MPFNREPITVVLVESSHSDADTVCQALAEVVGAGIKLVRLESVRHAEDYLSKTTADAIILDIAVPDDHGLSGFARIALAAPATPIIILSGSREEMIALRAVHEGAQDYVLKSQLSGFLLVRAIRYAIERKHAANIIRSTEARYREIFESNRDGILVATPAGTIMDANEAAARIFGYGRNELMQRNASALYRDHSVRERLLRHLDTHGSVMDFECQGAKRDGAIIDLVVNATTWRSTGGSLVAIQASIRDETSRKRAEVDLHKAIERFSAVVDVSPLPIIVVSEHNTVELWNAAAERAFGWTSEEVLNRPNPLVPIDIPDRTAEHVKETLSGTPIVGREMRKARRDGTTLDLRLWTAALPAAEDGSRSALGMLADVTEQKRLEEQFRQAQKMEAVGRLAGGVAHDFNNILTVIGGHAALGLADMDPNAPGRDDMLEVRKAVDRAAALTRQLLAFSRSQMLQPVVLDLNAVVADMERMLLRLIGEDIRIATCPAPDLQNITADQGQIEQVIMNLVVNARDAMPDGGTILITTRNATMNDLMQIDAALQDAAKYVLLEVCDSGHGMDAETQRRMFEPFFTTKVSKGTGLGLSTVYGIVKQSGGEITVQSSLGVGTNFSVFLPATSALPETPATQAPLQPQKGWGTVLVVDDEEAVRGLLTRVLKKHGYKVLPASNANEALGLVTECDGEIRLLLTDLVMPGTGGRELAETVKGMLPEIAVIYMSGYAEDSIADYSLTVTRENFIEKPFTPDSLIHAVQQAMIA